MNKGAKKKGQKGMSKAMKVCRVLRHEVQNGGCAIGLRSGRHGQLLGAGW